MLAGKHRSLDVPAQKNNSEVPATQQKLSAKPQEQMPNSLVGRKPQTSTVQPDPVLPRKHVLSYLNSASPPFYPSGASNLDISANQRRNVLAGSTNPITFSSAMQMKDYFPATQSNSFLKGKATVDTSSHDRLYMNAYLPVNAGKSVINPRLQSSGSSLSPPSPIQSFYSGIPGNGINVLPNYQHPLDQAARAALQHPPSQQRSHEAPLQPALQSSIQQLGQQLDILWLLKSICLLKLRLSQCTCSKAPPRFFDRSGMLYGELARFVLRLLGIRLRSRKLQLGPGEPGSYAIQGPYRQGQQYLEGPKAPTGSWDNVWGVTTALTGPAEEYTGISRSTIPFDTKGTASWGPEPFWVSNSSPATCPRASPAPSCLHLPSTSTNILKKPSPTTDLQGRRSLGRKDENPTEHLRS